MQIKVLEKLQLTIDTTQLQKMSKDRTSEPLGDVMVARLREAIMKEYPVSVTGLLNNYNLLFHENIKPEEYDCSDMYNFITHVSSKYNIWKVLLEDNQLRIKPSRVSSNTHHIGAGVDT